MFAVWPGSSLAVRAEPGDIPEKVPLYETPYGVGLNYKGNINYSSDGQSQAEGGSLDNAAEAVYQDGADARTVKPEKTVHIFSFWWLALLALLAAGLVSYFYVKGRRKKG